MRVINGNIVCGLLQVQDELRTHISPLFSPFSTALRPSPLSPPSCLSSSASLSGDPGERGYRRPTETSYSPSRPWNAKHSLSFPTPRRPHSRKTPNYDYEEKLQTRQKKHQTDSKINNFKPYICMVCRLHNVCSTKHNNGS